MGDPLTSVLQFHIQVYIYVHPYHGKPHDSNATTDIQLEVDALWLPLLTHVYLAAC